MQFSKDSFYMTLRTRLATVDAGFKPAGVLLIAVDARNADIPDAQRRAVFDRMMERSRALPGVVGTAIGLCDGAPCIRVFLADSGAAARRRIPTQLEGYPVKVEVTGPIRPRGPGTP